jgi:hypothetical protein
LGQHTLQGFQVTMDIGDDGQSHDQSSAFGFRG